MIKQIRQDQRRLISLLIGKNSKFGQFEIHTLKKPTSNHKKHKQIKCNSTHKRQYKNVLLLV